MAKIMITDEPYYGHLIALRTCSQMLKQIVSATLRKPIQNLDDLDEREYFDDLRHVQAVVLRVHEVVVGFIKTHSKE